MPPIDINEVDFVSDYKKTLLEITGIDLEKFSIDISNFDANKGIQGILDSALNIINSGDTIRGEVDFFSHLYYFFNNYIGKEDITSFVSIYMISGIFYKIAKEKYPKYINYSLFFLKKSCILIELFTIKGHIFQGGGSNSFFEYGNVLFEIGNTKEGEMYYLKGIKYFKKSDQYTDKIHLSNLYNLLVSISNYSPLETNKIIKYGLIGKSFSFKIKDKDIFVAINSIVNKQIENSEEGKKFKYTNFNINTSNIEENLKIKGIFSITLENLKNSIEKGNSSELLSYINTSGVFTISLGTKNSDNSPIKIVELINNQKYEQATQTIRKYFGVEDISNPQTKEDYNSLIYSQILLADCYGNIISNSKNIDEYKENYKNSFFKVLELLEESYKKGFTDFEDMVKFNFVISMLFVMKGLSEYIEYPLLTGLKLLSDKDLLNSVEYCRIISFIADIYYGLYESGKLSESYLFKAIKFYNLIPLYCINENLTHLLAIDSIEKMNKIVDYILEPSLNI